MKTRKKSGEVYIDVTEEQYQTMRAEGIEEDALLEPGRHKFVRGLFKKMHPNYEPKKAKVRISIYLDADVLTWFRMRAEKSNAAPYQTQINNELRALMERETTAETSAKKAKASEPSVDIAALLDNPSFIAAIAERVRQQTESGKRKRKAA
ncbi:MAG: BrnA antitoxin family protein [Blastocatellia bacterium]